MIRVSNELHWRGTHCWLIRTGKSGSDSWVYSWFSFYAHQSMNYLFHSLIQAWWLTDGSQLKLCLVVLEFMRRMISRTIVGVLSRKHSLQIRANSFVAVKIPLSLRRLSNMLRNVHFF